MESSTNRHDLVGVDRLVRLFATGQFFHQVGDRGHPRGATDQHHVGDIAYFDACFFNDVVKRLPGALDQVIGQFFELRPGDGLVEVGRTRFGERKVGKLDLGLGGTRQFLLGLLGCFLQTLFGDFVTGDVHAGGVFEPIGEVVHDALVPVVTTEAVVTGGGADLNGREVVVFAHFEQADVERSSTEVEDQNQFVFFSFVQAIGQGGRGGLVNNAQDIQPRDFSCFFGGLTLGVVEVGGDGNDRVGDRLA
ncbi:MAG: Uncharacterised protein [Cellulomonadaceae bacterium TMED98]|nr:MAG: Uncharacterised protein [Cellulomonadaceae bacterium TMED98]